MITLDIEAQPLRASENHIDRLIFGRFDGHEYGIGKMFDIAEKHNLVITCFFDFAEISIYGQRCSQIAKYILDRGHDLQLHFHPDIFKDWDGFSGKPLANFSKVNAQEADFLLDHMIKDYEDICKNTPVAFRGGGFRYNFDLLSSLNKHGILYNFGYNPAIANQDYNIGPQPPFKWSGFNVSEIPVPCIPQFLGSPGYTQFDYNCRPFRMGLDKAGENFKNYLAQYFELYPEGIAAMYMHSWSFLRKDQDNKFFCDINPDSPEHFDLFCSILEKEYDVLSSTQLARMSYVPEICRSWRKTWHEIDNRPKDGKYQCAVCGAPESDLVEFNGIPKRRCKNCLSLERQRSLAILLQTQEQMNLSGKKILHISAIPTETRILNKFANTEIVTLDRMPEMKPDIVGDIANVKHIPDKSFDVILACGVLSHVENIDKAFAELYRILKDDGIFLQWDFTDENCVTKEISDFEKITHNYGKEKFEKYKVGRFRSFGALDLDQFFMPWFERTAYKIIDQKDKAPEYWNCWKKNTSFSEFSASNTQKDEHLSTNEFFFLSTRNLHEFQKSHLYGYALIGDRMIFNSPVEQDFKAGADDILCCCTILSINEDKIRIYVDEAGYGALYLYKNGNFWAFSNSYGYLVEKLKYLGMPLNLNSGFAAQFLTGLCTPFTSGETLCQEISLLPVTSTVEIDKNTGNHVIIDQEPLKPVSILSDEGITIVDAWINKWIGILHGLSNSGVPYSQDLSGGMDSRMTFALTQAADIDLNKITISCDCKPDAEDYIIASSIADIYKTQLNANLTRKFDISYTDTYNINKYTKKYLHVTPLAGIAHDNIFKITGYGGESRRGEWDITLKEYTRLKRKNGIEQLYSQALSDVMTCGANALQMKIANEFTDKAKLMDILYRISRSRWHFGSASFASTFINIFRISPLADSMLNRLHLDDTHDRNFFVAFLMDRLASKLLAIPYDRARQISSLTIDEAKKINRIRPFKLQAITRKFSIPKENFYTYDKKNPDEAPYSVIRKCELWNQQAIFTRYYPKILFEETMNAKNLFGTRLEAILAICEFLN